MRKISVIIPAYNSWKTLRSCIVSIEKQTLAPLEIVVVDNASKDQTATKVEKFFPKVKLIRMKTNTGVTGGRNAGIFSASKKADYLFFFDHDMVADRSMLKNLVEVAEGSSEIGIVTPKIYYWEDKNRIWSAGTGMNLWTGQVLFRGGKDVGQYGRVEEVQVAPAAMLVRMGTIKKIKKFDNRYFAVYEDTDFCFRAKRAGFKTFYAPGAVAYHKLSTAPQDEAGRLLGRGYWVGRNRVLFMKDFGKNFMIFLLFLPLLSAYYLYTAVKYRNFAGGASFLRGTLAGLFG